MDVSEEQYFGRAARKTASCQAARDRSISGRGSRSSAPCATNDSTSARRPTRNDLLDFTGTDEALGKASGVDLLEGKLTLPLIYLLEDDAAARAAVKTVIEEGAYEKIKRVMLIDAAEKSGALRRARSRAAEYADGARKALDTLKPSKYADALRSIPTFILEREM